MITKTKGAGIGMRQRLVWPSWLVGLVRRIGWPDHPRAMPELDACGTAQESHRASSLVTVAQLRAVPSATGPRARASRTASSLRP
jgi:hypothetical protein